MKKPTFVIPHGYPNSYIDFYQMIRLSRIEKVTPSEVNPSDVNRCYIFGYGSYGHVAMHPRKATYVTWYLERIPMDEGQVTARRQMSSVFDYVWFSDRHLYQRWKDEYKNSVFVPMGSEVGLGEPGLVKNIDFVHVSYINARRHILNELPGSTARACYGEDKSRQLSCCKFMVNVHQDDHPMMEPLRFAICAAYGLPLLSENCEDPFPYEPNEDFIQVPYQEIKETARKILSQPYEKWRQMGLRMREKATVKFRFTDNIMRETEKL